MVSTDDTRDVIRDVIGRDAIVVDYERRYLLEQGYDTARNVAASYSRRPWIFACDSDEVVFSGIADGNIAIDRSVAFSRVVTVERHNLKRPNRWQPGMPIDLESLPPGSVERHRRLYRAGSGMHWKGYLHEVVRGPHVERSEATSKIVLKHYSAFREKSRNDRKADMYYWMLVQMHDGKKPKDGVNKYWLNEFIPANLERLREGAARFEESLKGDRDFMTPWGG